ncbi:MAG: Uma2 family endonuclease [Planctomycetaceae bacterium]
MSTAALIEPEALGLGQAARTVADLLEELGGIAPERVRLHPLPGEATANDLIENNDVRKDFRCELIRGTLVEKAHMSHVENSYTTVIAFYLHAYLMRTRLGKGFTEGAMYALLGGDIRLPDFTVCLNDKFPTGKVPRVSYVEFAPDLALEVLSKSNTAKEIRSKREILFASGTKLIWVLNPATRTVDIYTSVDNPITLTEADVLTGGNVLPGFELSIADWFREAEEV